MKRSKVSQAASLLGSIRSPKKAMASRRNGLKGGRPRKASMAPPGLDGSITEDDARAVTREDPRDG